MEEIIMNLVRYGFTVKTRECLNGEALRVVLNNNYEVDIMKGVSTIGSEKNLWEGTLFHGNDICHEKNSPVEYDDVEGNLDVNLPAQASGYGRGFCLMAHHYG